MTFFPSFGLFQIETLIRVVLILGTKWDRISEYYPPRIDPKQNRFFWIVEAHRLHVFEHIYMIDGRNYDILPEFLGELRLKFKVQGEFNPF